MQRINLKLYLQPDANASERLSLNSENFKGCQDDGFRKSIHKDDIKYMCFEFDRINQMR